MAKTSTVVTLEFNQLHKHQQDNALIWANRRHYKGYTRENINDFLLFEYDEKTDDLVSKIHRRFDKEGNPIMPDISGLDENCEKSDSQKSEVMKGYTNDFDYTEVPENDIEKQNELIKDGYREITFDEFIKNVQDIGY